MLTHRLTAGLAKAVAHHPRWSLVIFACLALLIVGQMLRPAPAAVTTTGRAILPPSIQAYFQQAAKRIEEQGGKLVNVAYLGSFKAGEDEDWSWFVATIESGQGRQIVSLVITLDRSGEIVRVE